MAAAESITTGTVSPPSAPPLHTSAGGMPVSLAALQQAGVQFNDAEAIAIGQALCLACTGVQSRDKNDGTAPVVVRVRSLDNETVLIDPTSRLGVRAVDPGDEATAIHYVGRVLSEIAPPETRKKIEKIITKALASPPQFGSLTDLSDALTKFETGERRELIQVVYEHWKCVSALAGTDAAAALDATPAPAIRFGSSMTTVRTAIIAVAVLVGGVSATILVARLSAGGAAIEEDAGADSTSSASPLLEARPIAPPSSGLVGWSVARANRPASSATVLPLERSHLRASIAAAPAAAKTVPVAAKTAPPVTKTVPAAPTPIAHSSARDESSAVSNPPMTRPADDIPAVPAPAGPTAAEPVRNAGRPVEHNAPLVIYSGQHKDVVPPTPVLPRRLAGFAQSPGVRSDTLLIAVVVDEQGRPHSVSAVNRPQNVAEAMLLTSALAAVKQWEFDPALKDGVPVRYRLIVPLGKVTGSTP